MPVPAEPQSQSASRLRRTQEERSTETRARLLDATIESLIDVGYAHTTTTAVCARAGLSRGAQVHHFPKKQDLVVSAVAHLATRRADELRGRAAELPAAASAEHRLGSLLSLAREALSGPLFLAALELWVASRTDVELHRALVRFERAAGRGLVDLWRDVAGPLADAARFDAVLELTMHLARGLALQQLLRRDDTARMRAFELWRELAIAALLHPSGAVPEPVSQPPEEDS
ncbi:TetR/AcrR family transcriptional regulator [Myxococcota bacterium]|nr:TetR/AcrR family transcriptional regulator [Myxococcota bacterium]